MITREELKNDLTTFLDGFKGQARSFQIEQSELALSWWEVADYQDYLLQRARQYGLVKEFRENGIC